MSSLTIDPPKVAEPARRKFTLLDAMILIAAISLGLMVPRVFKAVSEVGDAISILLLSSEAHFTIPATWLLIASATLALLVILSPKGCGPERFRRPGALAMFLVVLSWGYLVFQALVDQGRFVMNQGEFMYHLGMSLVFAPIMTLRAYAILPIVAGWITLGLLGERSSGRDWLDRSGIILGWAWILFGIFSNFLTSWS